MSIIAHILRSLSKICVLAIFFSQQVIAAEKDRLWSVSPFIGLHSPSLNAFNKGEFKATLPGSGSLLFEEENGNTSLNFNINNPLPEIKFGTEAGLEFQYALTKRDSFIIGTGTWEGGSTSSVITEIPFQGVLSQAAYERSANISYMQFFFGWRRDIVQRPKKFNLYTKLILHEYFDVDFKESLVFAFQTGPAETFKRIVVTETQATGILMFQLGVGTEYFMRDWLSFGLDVGYTFGVKKSSLGNGTITSDFQADDNITPILPTNLVTPTQLNYLTGVVNGEGVYDKELTLDFDGWRTLFKLNIYY